jgi:elongation factor G
MYRETITRAIDIEGRFDKEINEERQVGHVWLKIEPLPRGAGNQFVFSLANGKIPEMFLPDIERAFHDATLTGTIAGYPLVDLKATLFDGSYNESLSTALGYSVATTMALREGVEKAGPVLLEPMMNVEIVTPEEFMGDIIGDIHTRKGKIEMIENKGKTRIIKAYVSLKNMFGYSTALRSCSQGRATFSMKFAVFGKEGE